MPNVAFAETEPSGRRHLLLGKELNTFLALHVQIAEEGFVPAIKWKPSHRSRHADIDSHHAALDAMLKLASGFA